MNGKNFLSAIICLIIISLTGCSQEPSGQNSGGQTDKTVSNPESVQFQKDYETLPDNIQWLTNDTDPVYASDKAIKGGVLNTGLLSFPNTFRTVGPDSNSSFRSAILDNQLSLINIHPNTENILPELATHWAYGDDKKTMYFRLDKNARWSDGKPVTAWDYVYTLEFMRSEHIIAPWYNDYYTKEIEKVMVFDDYTIGIKSTKAVPDLHLKIGIGPVPRHYFGILDDTFVQKYNWATVPNTGAYQISKFDKGKFITFKRKKDWWAKDKRYFKNRFNVDFVRFEVIRDINLQWEHFKKGELEVFGLTMPKYWHEKSKHRVFENGYVKKIWFFNDKERSASGMWLNQDKDIFKDKNVRRAFSHAMNVQKVIEKVLRNDYFRLAQAVYGYGKYTDYSIKPRKFDIAKVEQLMTDAGWARGSDGIWTKDKRRFSVTVTYSLEDHMPRLVVLKEEAAKAGVELLLDRLDPSASYKKVMEKKHDVAWSGWGTGLRPVFWQFWHSDNAHKPQTNNITNMDHPEMDKLSIQYRDSLDENERIVLSKKMQHLIHEEACFVPTFMVPYVRLGYWRWMKLPQFHGTRRSENLFEPFDTTVGGLFWVDPDIKKETLDALKQGKTLEPVTIIDKQFKVE